VASRETHEPARKRVTDVTTALALPDLHTPHTPQHGSSVREPKQADLGLRQPMAIDRPRPTAWLRRHVGQRVNPTPRALGFRPCPFGAGEARQGTGQPDVGVSRAGLPDALYQRYLLPTTCGNG
jgi:hypothetical protein